MQSKKTVTLGICRWKNLREWFKVILLSLEIWSIFVQKNIFYKFSFCEKSTPRYLEFPWILMKLLHKKTSIFLDKVEVFYLSRPQKSDEMTLFLRYNA